MKIKSLNGTSDNTCACGSWIMHWKRFNRVGPELPSMCAVVNCKSSLLPTVGAHVQKVDGDKSWYIVPLCEKHNHERSSTLEIFDCIPLALANASETCAKQKFASIEAY